MKTCKADDPPLGCPHHHYFPPDSQFFLFFLTQHFFSHFTMLNVSKNARGVVRRHARAQLEPTTGASRDGLRGFELRFVGKQGGQTPAPPSSSRACKNFQIFQCSNVQTGRPNTGSNVQMFKYSNVQMHKCSNREAKHRLHPRLLRACTCSNVQMFKSPQTGGPNTGSIPVEGSLLHIGQIFECFEDLHKYSNVLRPAQCTLNTHFQMF